MFVRAKRSVQDGRAYEYLQICETWRDAGRVRRRVLTNLGRLDHLTASGQLDGIIRSMARFSERLRVIEAARTEGMVAHSAKVWGPAALAAIRAAEMRPPPRIRQIPVERRAKKMAKAKLRRDCKEFQKSGVENE